MFNYIFVFGVKHHFQMKCIKFISFIDLYISNLTTFTKGFEHVNHWQINLITNLIRSNTIHDDSSEFLDGIRIFIFFNTAV